MLPDKVRPLVFSIIFIIGVILILTSNIKFAIGVLFTIIGLQELGRANIIKRFDQLKDLLDLDSDNDEK